MSVTRLILILFLIISGIFQVQATNYCAKTITSTDGSGYILKLTCSQIDPTHWLYQLDFPFVVTGFQNSNVWITTSDGNFNISDKLSGFGTTTLSWIIYSTFTPINYKSDNITVNISGGGMARWYQVLPTSPDVNFANSCTPSANAGLPQSVCKNAPFTLGGAPTASGGTAPYTYAWASSSGSFSSTLANPTASITTTTNYTVTVTDAATPPLTATSNVVITITTTAAAPTVTSNSPLQAGQTLNLYCSPAYSSYAWTGPSSFTNTLQNPTRPSMAPGYVGTYTVSVTDAYGCKNSGTVSVSIRTSATYYINDNTIGEVGAWCSAVGSDISGTGTASQPYATLNYLLSQKTLYGGDVVNIDIGTYNWATSNFTGDDKGSSASQLVINGAGATKTFITSSSGIGFYSNTSSNNYITFQNFSITAATAYSAFNWTSPQYIQILNCAISSNISSGGAIHFNTSSNNNTISGNTISQTNTGGSGIYFQGATHSYNTISKNKINGVNGSNLEPLNGIYFQSGPNNNNLIVNNFIANFQNGISQAGNNYTNLYNNSFYCKKYCFKGMLDNMDITNNIFHTYGTGTSSNKNYCIYVTYVFVDPPSSIDYNIYYHLDQVYTYCAYYPSFPKILSDWQDATGGDVNSLEPDPLYKTPTSGDLHLASNLSPAFNAGVTISVTDDIDNESRPLGAAYDIGADEYNFALLPVKLISFNAFCMDGSVKINWATATETNNDYFILEKSIDAKNFIPLAHIKGAGNSNKMLNYSFNDNEPLPGNQYYRLTQVDYNGQKEIFNISNANCNSSISDSYKAYYYNGKIYITINSSTIEKMYIQLLDITGRLVFSDLKQLNENTFTYDIPVEQLSKGIYILKLFNNNKKYLQKIIIK